MLTMYIHFTEGAVCSWLGAVLVPFLLQLLYPAAVHATMFCLLLCCVTYTHLNKSFISPTNAQLNCFKILKFTLKFTINAPTCFGLIKPSSGSLQSVLC